MISSDLGVNLKNIRHAEINGLSKNFGFELVPSRSQSKHNTESV